MISYGRTDVGSKRQMNQDYVYYSDKPVGNLPNLYIVADGMGGHKAGDVASRYTVTQFVSHIKENNGRFPKRTYNMWPYCQRTNGKKTAPVSACASRSIRSRARSTPPRRRSASALSRDRFAFRTETI